MRLVEAQEDTWRYALSEQEAELLAGLLQRFPFGDLKQVRVSKHAPNPDDAEREALLNEYLAAHREELRRLAAGLAAKLSKQDQDYSLVLDGEAREVLMQILNDIRVTAWRSLGEPESLETPRETANLSERVQWELMNLAGYFEASLLESPI